MIAKFRHSLGLKGEWTFKKIAGAMIFIAIIIVFVGFNVRNDTGGDNTGGLAAIVNDVPISLATFSLEADQRERMINERLGGVPEEQRKLYRSTIRAQVLESLITGEMIYQTAARHGVLAADGEVRQVIASYPVLQENGVFQLERYKMFLQQTNQSAADFERATRKQIVTQKLYELFLGAATPSAAELARNRVLANQKIGVRFVEFSKDDLNKLTRVSDAEAQDFERTHGTEIESYYKDNKIEFTKPARYHARDLMVRVDEKRKDADARRMVDELAKQATPQNFAELVKSKSEDPGSKAKGGDLGDREQGSLPASFETPVLALAPGTISKPIKVEGGYHLVLLESKVASGTAPLDAVRNDIARRLLARSSQDKALTQAKDAVASGDRKKVDALIATLGKKWSAPTEFDLSNATIPKLGDAKDVLKGVVETGGPGLVKRLLSANNQNVVVDVVSWKTVPDKAEAVAGLDRMVAAKRAEGAFEAWIKNIEKGASITRNTRLLQ